MSRLLFVGIGAGLVVLALLVLRFEAPKQAAVNHAKDKVSAQVAQTDTQHSPTQDLSGSRSDVTDQPTSIQPTRTAKNPSLVDRERMETLLTPSVPHKLVGNLLTRQDDGRVDYLEIEVSHSAHVFKLYASSTSGKKVLLHECKVGLGSPSEFPTPVGVYYITHIYDDNPRWIPPANQAWAVGQKPNRTMYGGTMVPMLKKRLASAKHQNAGSEDALSVPVKLDDDGYSFHGTDDPRNIGRNLTHGDIVMMSEDARKVANLIKERVGIAERRESEHGTSAVLKAPVRLNLVK